MKKLLLLVLALALQQGTRQSIAQAGPRPDPPGPQWMSEDFSEKAGAVWKGIAHDLLENRISGSEAATTGSLRPNDLATILEDGNFTVRRSTAKEEGKSRPLSRALVTLTTLFDNDGPDRAKFKVFNIDMTDPTSPVTRQYVSLAGRSADRGYLEINMVWRAEWKQTGQNPELAKVHPESYEEIAYRSPENSPVFSDSTESVLGTDASYQKQLRFGNTHWRQRIEVFNRFFKFGHHGLAVGDINGDGWDDLYVCQNGGLPNRLYVRQADGTARDVAAASGVDLLDLTRSALLVDLDNDGDQDLVLAADTGLLAFRNDGRGRFKARLRYPKIRNAFGLSAADYDNDGDLDLYVCRYFAKKEEGAGLAVPVPYFAANNGGGNFLIRNDGPSSNPSNWLDFSDATTASGLEAQNNRRFSFASVWEDVDRDGDQDLFVANDFGLKNLYVNNKGTFRDTALASGIDDGGFGMSACAGDFDGDGTPDLYAGNMFSAAGNRVTRQPQFRPGLDSAIRSRFQRMARGNSLFRGRGVNASGVPVYDDVSESTGVTVGRWSWGSLFVDFNNDGWEDLMVANGFVTGSVPDDL